VKESNLLLKSLVSALAMVFLQCNAPLRNTSSFRMPEFMVNYGNIVMHSFGCQGNSAEAPNLEYFLLDCYKWTRNKCVVFTCIRQINITTGRRVLMRHKRY
jgi:hypothetical protein